MTFLLHVNDDDDDDDDDDDGEDDNDGEEEDDDDICEWQIELPAVVGWVGITI